jgi:hypothetical protein
MKSQRTLAPILALMASALMLGADGVAKAQGAPVYIGPGAPPPFEPPRYVRAEPLPDDVLLPQEVIGILRSTGFSALSAPIRRGRFYIVAAVHPDGEDGQVTIDAITGRFIRFVPADMIGRSMAAYPPPSYAPLRRGLRPPMPVPGIASHAPTPVPAARPLSASQTNAQTANAGSANPTAPAQATKAKTAENKTANASTTVNARSADPVEVKPSFGKPTEGPALRPTGPMPPAQGFE